MNIMRRHDITGFFLIDLIFRCMVQDAILFVLLLAFLSKNGRLTVHVF